jgi:hypothetical protein
VITKQTEEIKQLRKIFQDASFFHFQMEEIRGKKQKNALFFGKYL